MLLTVCLYIFQEIHEVRILDPSNRFRPEKSEALFRDFTASGPYYNLVHNTYQQMHTKQTLQYARDKVYK